MAGSLFPDPMQLWREALTRLEKDVNSLATGSLESQDVMRSLHQFSTASLGVQSVVERLLEAYLRKANLPSRKDIAALAQTLARVEEKLDRLLPASPPPARPARTRRPAAKNKD
ncbi:MAG: hypothetical protein JSS56_23585 [Proteobacteria bacterium]|nr:hypothetical protein [Pseudomonadota bacterium]